MSMISHLKWMGHSATIFEIQKSLREDQHSCEVTLVAKDYSVRAHRFVLSSCSDLLRNLMVDLPTGQEATVIVPDIKGELLDSVLAFVYMGETQISSSNLSDFLEAINILGIKSAISFECNTIARQTQNPNALPLKTITGLQIVQEDIIEHDNVPLQKIDSQNVIEPQEFLEVYGEEHPKIHYAIEQVSVPNSASEFILTENAGEFTLTPNSKIGQNAPSHDTAKLAADGMEVEEAETEVDADADGEVGADADADADDGSLIEEYSSSAAENIIEMATASATNTTESTLNVPSSAVATTAATSTVGAEIIEIKPNMRTVKIKDSSLHHHHQPLQQQRQNSQQKQQQQQHQATIFNSNELISTKETQYSIYPDSVTVTDSPSTSSRPIKTEILTSDPLELAVQAVLNEGMSLQKAAQKHDISKTVLWRRVRKEPNYNKASRENPVLSLACERLKHGESMKNISRDLDIPMSTLHRHKVRLLLQGRLPKWVTFKTRDANSKDELREKLNKAVHACIHDGMSQNHAANLYGIPKSTLWRHLQKRVAEAEAMVTEDIKQEIILP